MCGGDAAGRVVAVGEFGCDVELRAAAVARPANPLSDPLEVCRKLAGRIVTVAIRDGLPCAPEVFVFAREKRSHKVVFRAEVAVEAGLGDPGFFDDKINTHGTHAATVEQPRSGLEDPLPYIGRLPPCLV